MFTSAVDYYYCQFVILDFTKTKNKLKEDLYNSEGGKFKLEEELQKLSSENKKLMEQISEYENKKSVDMKNKDVSIDVRIGKLNLLLLKCYIYNNF